jgi:hypothetical protein
VPGHGKGDGDRNPSLSISRGDRQPLLVHCHGGCDPRDVFAALRDIGHIEPASPQYSGQRGIDAGPDRTRSNLPEWLWNQALPVQDGPAVTYLSQRGLGRSLPATLRYLPRSRQHEHAMIAAFGLAEEIEPGRLKAPAHPTAVHLTRLAADGSSRIDKRMLGPVSGQPIILAPPNDGLGLVIAEGIEDALSLHEATGLGAWAGGSAGHMSKLGEVVPGYIECVTLAEDANEAGRRACSRLAEDLLRRGIEVRILRIGG